MASDFLKGMAAQQKAKRNNTATTEPTQTAGLQSSSLQVQPSASQQTQQTGQKKASSFLQGMAEQSRQRALQTASDWAAGKNKAPAWESVEEAAGQLQGWEKDLAGMEARIKTARARTEEAQKELTAVYQAIQTAQADPRLGSDPIISAGYDNNVKKYNELLPSYLAAAKEHDGLVEQYNATLDRYNSGRQAYTTLLSQQGSRSKEYLDQAAELEEANRKLSTEIAAMQTGISRAGAHATQGMKDGLAQKQAELEANKRTIQELRTKAETAKGYYYGTIPMMEDYGELSKATGKKKADGWRLFGDNGDDKYDFINDIEGYRDIVQVLSLGTNQREKYGGYTKYSYMTPDEIGVYNYLYAKDGKDAAEGFLKELESVLNYRYGTETYENLSGVGKALYWLPAGADRFASGIGQLFSKEALPTSPIQYTSSMIRQQAGETSPLLGFAYDLGTTASNMAPSILLSYLTAGLLGEAGVAADMAGKIAGGVGAGSMGLSAGGNAYTEKVNQGHAPEQARQYATLVGISEAALQYLLGGIESLGGISAEQVAVKVAGIDNALARVALTVGSKMFSEGLEEGLQEILEPAFATLILGEEYSVNYEDVAYAFLMGAIMAGVMEGPGVIKGNLSKPSFDANMAGYKTETGVDYFADCATMEEVEAKYKKLARENHPDMGGSESVMADINKQRDMRKAFYDGVAQASKKKGESQETTVEPDQEVNRQAAENSGLALPAPYEFGTPVDQDVSVGTAVPPVQTAPDTGLSLPTVEGMEQTQAPTVEPVEPLEAQGTQRPAPELPKMETPAQPEAPAVADILNGGIENVQTAEQPQPAPAPQREAEQPATGDPVSGGDGGRLPGGRPAEQTGGLAEGPGNRRRSEQVRAASARQNRVKDLRVKPISSREMGLLSGTDERVAKEVPPEAYDQEMTDLAERFERRGYNVKYFTGLLQVATASGPVRVNGAIQGSDVFIQADNMRWSINQIADHEDFHAEVANDPGLVTAIRDRIMDQFSEAEFTTVVETYIKKLRGVIDIPENASEVEIEAAVRDILEEIFADAYADKNAFSAGATKYTGTVREVVQERGGGRDLETAPTRGPPEGRYSYAGRNANRADSESLARAERMELEGTDAETIRQETGWHRGMDGLWRFEIDDSGMTYRRAGDARYMDMEGYQEYLDLWDKVVAKGEAEPGDMERLRELDRDFGHVAQVMGMRLTNAGATLGDILIHDELFQNYPQLRNMPVRFAELPRGTLGQFSDGEIVLSNTLRAAPEETLIHEIEHAIQKAENFTPGSSPEYWADKTDKELSARAREHQAERNRITENLPKDVAERFGLWAVYDGIPSQRGEAGGIALQLVKEGYGEQFREYQRIEREYRKSRPEYRSAQDLYTHTAGEIEARDAASRRNLTAEERKTTPPDLGDENTVFAEREDFSDAVQRQITGDGLQEEAGRGTIPEETTDMEVESDAREESREHFLARSTESDHGGFAVFERGQYAYGYRRCDPVHLRGPAREFAQELKALGVPGDVMDGTVLKNKDGLTVERTVDEAATIGRSRVLINQDTTVSPKNGAGHEAFHYWNGTDATAAFKEAVELNLIYTSQEFQQLQAWIAERYFGEEIDLNNEKQYRGFREELFAYIAGDIHEGTSDTKLRAMFKDYDAVKAAWSELVESQKPTEGLSLPEVEGDALPIQERAAKFSTEDEGGQTIEEMESRLDAVRAELRELGQQEANFKVDEHTKALYDAIDHMEGADLDAAVQEYKDWTESSGYAELSRRMEVLRDEERTLFRTVERAKEAAAKAAKEAYRATYSLEMAKKYAAKAARKFGTTSRFDLAGYITVTGSLLDFSERQGYRVQDHREIAQVLDFLPDGHGYSDGLIEFMNLGNIRLQSYGIDITKPPTDAQRPVLRRFFDSLGGEVTVDISDENGNTVDSVDYQEGTRAEKILADLDTYFKTGEIPRQSTVAEFHTRYSVEDDQEYLEAVDRGDTKKVQKMVDRAADRAGYTIKAYHGTPKGGFTFFDEARIGSASDYGWFGKGFYFTTKPDVARVYSGSGYAPKGEVIEAYLRINNPFDFEAAGRDGESAGDIMSRVMGKEYGDWSGVSEEQKAQRSEDFTRWLRDNGYDGAKAWSQYMILDSDQAKRADPVTYDDQGKPIPLSERFDKGTGDIRYSVEDELLNRDDVILGESDETFTDDDRAVGFTYAVVPAEALLVSNDEYGSPNPAYPAELQPRDRRRTSSQTQIQNMSRKLNPRMLAESATAQNGAPIIRGDGAVIGGNARTQAILTAYRTGRAGEYEKFIREKGAKYGLDTTKLPKDPVLVRIAQGVDDWVKLAQDLNATTTAAYSTTEQAMTDAQKMGSILELLVPTEDGGLNNAENRTFIQQFIQRVVPESERGGMLTETGLLSQRGLERAEYAIFARAYGDPSLLAKLSESLDNDTKNVTNALLDTAAAAVAIQSGEKDGTTYATGAVEMVLKGAQIYTEAKKQGRTVAEFVAQASLLEEYEPGRVWIAQFIEENKRSAKQIRTFINGLYEEVESYGDPNQESIFGGEEHDGRQALEGAIRRYERATGRSIGLPDYGGARSQPAAAPAGGGERAEAGDLRSVGEGPGTPAVPGGGDAENPVQDGGREPEGLTLPTAEEAPAATVQEEAAPPAPARDYQQELMEALVQGMLGGKAPQQTPQVSRNPDGTTNLFRDEGMTDEEYEFLNEQHRAQQQEQMRRDAERYGTDPAARAEAIRQERLRYVSKEDFIGTPALEKLGVRVENSVGIYEFIQSLIENDKAAKSLRKELRRAEKRLGATEAERNFASGVAAGIYTQEDIPSTMDADKVMELADYYWAERAVASDELRQQRADINRVLAERMRELFKDSDAFKPSRAIVLNNRTPERNMLHIFGDERGAAINAAIFDPVAVNEAERLRFKNRMLDEVRTFEDSKGRQSRLTKEERAIVQQVIEGRAVGEMVAGMEMAAAIQNAAENINNGMEPGDAAQSQGLDQEQRRLAEKYARWLQTKEALESGKVDSVKVENAVKKYTELFDLFYDATNDFLVAHGDEPVGFIKGYAPHLQPEDNINLLNKALQSLGINTDVTRLPASIAGLTADYRPNKRWNPYFLTRTSDITAYDIATAFESYVDYMSDVFYHTDDIMRVRQAANYFRRTYAPEEIRQNLEWAEELRFAPTDRKATFLRDRGVLSKTSAVTAADISRMMDEYVDGLYEAITKTTKFSDLVMYLDNYANILAGKQSMADRGWEYSGGRTVLNIGNKLVRAFGKAQVAGNLSSALNQTAQIPQIQAELGARWTAGAIMDIWSGKLRRAGWAQESDFLTGKKGINYLVTDPADMVITALFTPAEMMDTFVSTVAVRGKYLKEIHAGKSHKEAMKAADAFGKAVMGSRMKGSRPLGFEAKNPVSQMLHIFQVEAINSWEHISQDLPRDFRKIEQEQGKAKAAWSLAGVIVKMLLAAFFLNRLAEETYGGTPAPFDILGLSANFVASGEGLTTNEWLRTMIDNGWEQITGERLFETDATATEGDFDWAAAMEDTAYNVSNDIPFLRNAAGLLGLGDETLPMPDLYGSIKDIVTAAQNSGPVSPEMGNAILGLLFQVMPAGRQLKKTTQGAETLIRGGRYKGYGDNERLQYPVDRDFWDVVRALMFGNSGLPETEEFYASGQKGLSAKQTKLYQSMVDGGADQKEVYKAIQDYRAIDNDKDITSYERGVQERNLIRGLDLTDQQKLELYHGLTGADSRAEKFKAIMDTGLAWDRVMDAYDKYAELDAGEEMTAGQKASALAAWVDREGFTGTQADTIKEQLKFFSIIPAEAKRYETLTGAGLDPEDAFNLTAAFADLVPTDGHSSVTDMQRYRVIAGAKLTDEEKINAIGSIMGTDLETESGNPSQYAKMLSVLDTGLSLDEYLDLKEAGAVEQFLKYTDKGADPKEAAGMAASMVQTKEDLGEDGTRLELYRAAVNSTSNEQDQLAALAALMGEAEFKKVQTGYTFGVTPDQYVRVREAIATIDTNNSVTQAEATQAIQPMLGLTTEQKAVLWQLQNKSWKAKNNPFSTSVGDRVKAALDQEDDGLKLPSLGGQTTLPSLGSGEQDTAGTLPGLSLPKLGG